MRKLILFLIIFVFPVIVKAQAYFYYSEKRSYDEVVVIYFVNGNKIIRELDQFVNVRKILMSDIDAYDKKLRKHANEDIYYDTNNCLSSDGFIRACEFKQTLSGYNIYAFWQKFAVYYGKYELQLDLGISSDKQTVVRDITCDTPKYYKRVDKSFFLPQL